MRRPRPFVVSFLIRLLKRIIRELCLSAPAKKKINLREYFSSFRSCRKVRLAYRARENQAFYGFSAKWDLRNRPQSSKF
jgi:hypothetical protein